MAKLGEVCIVQSGGTPSRSKQEYWNNGRIPWVKISDIKSKYLNETEECITEEGLNNSSAKIFPKGTLLYTIFATLGEVCVLNIAASTNQAIAGIQIVDEKIDSDYLYYFLCSLKNQVNQIGRGVAQNNINMSILRNIEVPIPNKETQQMRSAVLSLIDKQLRMRNKQLELLDELVKSRFIEMFGDLASPECNWRLERLQDICEKSDDIKCGPFGTQLSKDEYQLEGIALWEIPQINNHFSTAPTHFLTPEKAMKLDSYSIIPGDIAMSRKGNVGKCAVFPKEYKAGIIHSDVLRIRVDKKQVVSVFMMYQLHYSRAVQHQIELISSGAIMAGINVTKLKQIYVYLPPSTFKTNSPILLLKWTNQNWQCRRAWNSWRC